MPVDKTIVEGVADTLTLQAIHLERCARSMVGLPTVCEQVARDLRAESRKLYEATRAVPSTGV